ncbi:thermonuclease family protein [Tomitella fengzijianii]|nr:thermonuclease family protein [Tomitella fengzijianii]
MRHRIRIAAGLAGLAGITALATAGCATTSLDPATPAAAPSSAASNPQGGVMTGHRQGGVLTGHTEPATVTRVVDGDTILAEAGGTQLRVRILGIDTPETVDPDQPTQCYGPEASAFAHDTLDGKTVTLRTDPAQDTADRYGRALRYVELDGTGDYSIAAARGGYAKPYVYHDNPVRKARQIAAAAADARTAGRGLWGACPQ